VLIASVLIASAVYSEYAALVKLEIINVPVRILLLEFGRDLLTCLVRGLALTFELECAPLELDKKRAFLLD
jgi:hypothetical protein